MVLMGTDGGDWINSMVETKKSLLFLMVDCCKVCHSAVCCQSAVFSAVPHNGLPTNGATDGQLTSIPWMVGASPRLRHAILIVKHC